MINSKIQDPGGQLITETPDPDLSTDLEPQPCLLEDFGKLTEEIFRDLAAMVGVDETQGVESAPLGVAGAGAGRILGQVGLHQGQRLLLVAPKQKSMLKG